MWIPNKSSLKEERQSCGQHYTKSWWWASSAANTFAKWILRSQKLRVTNFGQRQTEFFDLVLGSGRARGELLGFQKKTDWTFLPKRLSLSWLTENFCIHTISHSKKRQMSCFRASPALRCKENFVPISILSVLSFVSLMEDLNFETINFKIFEVF